MNINYYKNNNFNKFVLIEYDEPDDSFSDDPYIIETYIKDTYIITANSSNTNKEKINPDEMFLDILEIGRFLESCESPFEKVDFDYNTYYDHESFYIDYLLKTSYKKEILQRSEEYFKKYGVPNAFLDFENKWLKSKTTLNLFLVFAHFFYVLFFINEKRKKRKKVSNLKLYNLIEGNYEILSNIVSEILEKLSANITIVPFLDKKTNTISFEFETNSFLVIAIVNLFNLYNNDYYNYFISICKNCGNPFINKNKNKIYCDETECNLERKRKRQQKSQNKKKKKLK